MFHDELRAALPKYRPEPSAGRNRVDAERVTATRDLHAAPFDVARPARPHDPVEPAPISCGLTGRFIRSSGPTPWNVVLSKIAVLVWDRCRCRSIRC